MNIHEGKVKFLSVKNQLKSELFVSGGLSQYNKDPGQLDNINRMAAMNRYHKRFGTVCLKHKS